MNFVHPGAYTTALPCSTWDILSARHDPTNIYRSEDLWSLGSRCRTWRNRQTIRICHVTWKANFGLPSYCLEVLHEKAFHGLPFQNLTVSRAVCVQGVWLQVLQVIKQSTAFRSCSVWRMRSHCIFRSTLCCCEACSCSPFTFFPSPFFFLFFFSFTVNNLAGACRRLF